MGSKVIAAVAVAVAAAAATVAAALSMVAVATAAAADSAAADTVVAVASARATVAAAAWLQVASSGQGSKGSVAAWDGASMGVARAAAGVAAAAAAGAEDGRSFWRRTRPFRPRGQAGVAGTCRTRPGTWSARWNRRHTRRPVQRSRSTAWVRRSSQRRRCPHHQRKCECAAAAAAAASARPTLPDAHQSPRHLVVSLSSPSWHSPAGPRARARPIRSTYYGRSDCASPKSRSACSGRIVPAPSSLPRRAMQV